MAGETEEERNADYAAAAAETKRLLQEEVARLEAERQRLQGKQK